jgi:hypothetical protein
MTHHFVRLAPNSTAHGFDFPDAHFVEGRKRVGVGGSVSVEGDEDSMYVPGARLGAKVTVREESRSNLVWLS